MDGVRAPGSRGLVPAKVRPQPIISKPTSQPTLVEPAAEPKQSFLRKWLPVVVLSLALMIIVIDTTILNVSLRTIILDLHAKITGIQWVISAYSLTIASLTITGGRLGDLFGRKRMFMIGAVIFAIGSFITSISHGIPMMLAGESIIEGIGAALMMPATASLLVALYRGRDRAIAFGVWGGVAAASAAIGPIVGGYLTTHYSWRWAFRINVLVALVLLLGSLIIKESRDLEEKKELDYLGVLLSAGGLFALVYGIIQASSFGWFRATQIFHFHSYALPYNLSITPVAMGLGVGLLILFGLWQSFRSNHRHTPLVSLKLLTNRQFISGAMVTGLLSLAQIGLIFVLPVFFQGVLHLDALHTAYALLPMTLPLLVAALLSGFLIKYIKPRPLIQTGLALNLVGVWLLHQATTVAATTASFRPGLIVYGFGVGLCIAQTSNLTLSAVSVQEAGEASGVNSTLRQIGSTLGSAIVGAVLISTLTANLKSGVTDSPVIPQTIKPQLSQTVSSQATSVEFNTGAVDHSGTPAYITSEVAEISHRATVTANRRSFIVMGLVVVLSLLVSLFLPGGHDLESNHSAAKPAGH